MLPDKQRKSLISCEAIAVQISWLTDCDCIVISAVLFDVAGPIRFTFRNHQNVTRLQNHGFIITDCSD